MTLPDQPKEQSPLLLRQSIAEAEPAILSAVESGSPDDLRRATAAADAWMSGVEG